MRILYDNSGLMIVLSELTWRAPLLLLEDAIEVTEVIETAVEPISLMLLAVSTSILAA